MENSNRKIGTVDGEKDIVGMNDLELIKLQKKITLVENQGRTKACELLARARKLSPEPLSIKMLIFDNDGSDVLLAAARHLTNQGVKVFLTVFGGHGRLSEPSRKLFESARSYGAKAVSTPESEVFFTQLEENEQEADANAAAASSAALLAIGLGAKYDRKKIAESELPVPEDEIAVYTTGRDGPAQRAAERAADILGETRVANVKFDPYFHNPPPSGKEEIFRPNAMIISRERARLLDTRAIDKYGIHGLALMENAGYGAARAVYLDARAIEAEKGASPNVTVIAGRGNNGGDGFVVARNLAWWGVIPRVWIVGSPDRMTDDARANLLSIEVEKLSYRYSKGLDEKPAVVSFEDARDAPENLRGAIASADIVVDALLGTGLAGEVREPYASVIAAIVEARENGARIIAVDTPSGLDCNKGIPLGTAVKADRTLTFAAPKLGLTLSRAAKYVGDLEVVDICWPVELAAPDEGE